MWKIFFKKGQTLLTQRQRSISSAAAVIMLMIALSRLLGLVRNRILAHFFTAETLSVYFAAFRLPETVFEILIFGTLASAFIPTFTAYFSRNQKEGAWCMASSAVNIALAFFLLFAIILLVLSDQLYRFLTPGFSLSEVELTADLARILLLAQMFFILSYFLTAILESFQRFVIPSLSPLFYNLGIILGTIFLADRMGIYAPTIGAVVGAFLHFLIQVPLAFHLGFRPRFVFDFNNPGVRKIIQLAAPRVAELSFLQISKGVELFLSSLISSGAYTYYTFANSLQLLPVGLFGTSVAKAALPSLSYQAAKGDGDKFKMTFSSLFGQIFFLTFPLSVFLAVLRIPLVRLALGATNFTWESTVQTGLTLSAFCLGITAQSLIYLLNRAFYALHDTKTPVKLSIEGMILNILFGVLFILILKLPIWSLALAFSLSSIAQVVFSCLFLEKRIGFFSRTLFASLVKIILSSLMSGGAMFFFLKVLDRSAWDKKLSFLGQFGLVLPTSFDRLVLDTRYTANLIHLLVIVILIGVTTYVVMIKSFRVPEAEIFTKTLVKLANRKITF